ncbi:type II toxin-antitoxin system VapC family toxin [Cereibacter sp. SYSU M97828]|nr:type II toxin-antitoxin system VapC family toxin [Cereibacter flavus]
MFLLDTNVISELRKAGSGRADPNVIAWVSQAEAGSFFMSAITVMELEIGVLRIERRDAAQGRALREWLDGRVLAEFADRILPVDAAVALRCAALHVPDQRSERDALIAATAMVHGMTVVTRNTADFAPSGVRLVDPWQR